MSRSLKIAAALLVVLFLSWVYLAPANRMAAAIYDGDSHYLEHDFKSSLLSYLKAVRIKPDGWRAHLRVGMAYQSLGEEDKALPYFQRSVQLAPTEPEALLRTASCLINLKQPDKARDYIRTELSQHPGTFDCFYLLAEAAVAEQDYQEAEKFLNKIIEINPYHTGAYWELAKVQAQFDTEAALASCQKVLNLGAWPEKRRDAFLLAASLYLQQGKVEQARQALQTLLVTYPGTPQAQRAQQALETM